MANAEGFDARVLGDVLEEPGDDVESGEHEDRNEVVVGDHVLDSFLDRRDVHEGADRHVQNVDEALDDKRPGQAGR